MIRIESFLSRVERQEYFGLRSVAAYRRKNRKLTDMLCRKFKCGKYRQGFDKLRHDAKLLDHERQTILEGVRVILEEIV